MDIQSIAKNLVYQRKLKGYTQEELSERTQVTVRTIQRIEKGDVNPHLQTVKMLATALDVQVEDLLPLENPKEEAIQKKWLLLIHSTPILGFILPLCNILFPLFLWIHKREDNAIYELHGRKVINFQITISLLYIISLIALVTVEKWGFFFFIVIIPFGVMVMFGNIISAVNSQKCFYPLAIPFIGKSKRAIKNVVLGLLFSALLIACTDTKVDTIARLDGSSIQKDSLTHKIEQLMQEAEVQGMAVTLLNDNEIVYKRTFGYKNLKEKQELNDSTSIYGASYSKAVFAVLVMKLVDEGVLDLDTPLESYLPKKMYEYPKLTRWHDDFSALKNDSLYHKITARMCLAHTTGFPNYRWFEKDYQLRVKFEPGSRYSYSGEGFIYLQVVLERLLGKTLEELAQDKIFKPLAMSRSSYQWNPTFETDFAHGHSSNGELYPKDTDNEPRGGGTLETTADDYSKFMEAVLQQKIISKTAWEELFSPQISIKSIRQFGPLALKDSTLNDAIQLSYGLGWGLLETPYGKGAFKEGHADGFQNYSIVFPKAKKGIMIMSNSDNAEGIFKELLEVAIGDKYTPWEWENYIPYNQK